MVYEPGEKRYLYSVKELTSRLREDEIPKAIEELEKEYVNKQSYAVDCCLASNIIEVGVDIRSTVTHGSGWSAEIHFAIYSGSLVELVENGGRDRD